MSVSKWRYTEACDGAPCPGDCDECGVETDRDCSNCKHLKLMIRPNTQFYACEKWECEFEAKEGEE